MSKLKVAILTSSLVISIGVMTFTVRSCAKVVGNGIDRIVFENSYQRSELNVLEFKLARVKVRLYHNPEDENLQEEKEVLKSKIADLSCNKLDNLIQ